MVSLLIASWRWRGRKSKGTRSIDFFFLLLFCDCIRFRSTFSNKCTSRLLQNTSCNNNKNAPNIKKKSFNFFFLTFFCHLHCIQMGHICCLVVIGGWKGRPQFLQHIFFPNRVERPKEHPDSAPPSHIHLVSYTEHFSEWRSLIPSRYQAQAWSHVRYSNT